MDLLESLWKKLTPTQALEDSSGELETAFFGSMYRVTYLAGFSGSDRGCLYQLYSLTVKLLVILFNTCTTWFLLNARSFDLIIEQAAVVVIQFIGLLRYWNIRNHRRLIKKLASAMESPNFDMSTSARRDLVESWRMTTERYWKLIIGLGTCTLAAWYVYPLVDDLEYNLPVYVRVPLDYHTPLRYPIVYVATMVSFHYSAYFVMNNDVTLQAVLVHLLCQFTVLADCFKNILVECKEEFKGLSQNELIYNKEFRQKYLTRLSRLVDQHKLLLDHTLELRKVLSIPMLLQVSASGLQICFAAYQVAMNLQLQLNLTKFLMSFLYLGYNLFQLFIFCRWCDEIKIQSENIRGALYCSGWESGIAIIPGVRRRLLLIAMRANKPLVLTAGGLYDLSLSSFADLVKTSYSALTVLLRLR